MNKILKKQMNQNILKCRICNSSEYLLADHGGLYKHAIDLEGKPYYCTMCVVEKYRKECY